MQLGLWVRRKNQDKAENSSSKSAPMYSSKKASSDNHDKDFTLAGQSKKPNQPYMRETSKADGGIVAFAFGGVEPGTLHAKGHPQKVHQVRYSIGLAGRYRLHVGLRQQGVALPGSPFLLEVSPGAAFAPSTRIRAEDLPLQGIIGSTDDDESDQNHGCQIVLRTCDRMGNFCTQGGSNVVIQAGQPIIDRHHAKGSKSHSEEEPEREAHVKTKVTDNGDGSYILKWTSQFSGTFPVKVMIDSMHVFGSPTTLLIVSGPPEVNKCMIAGDGLQQATAGMPAIISVLAKDRYENLAQSSAALSFGLLLLPTSELKADAQAMKEQIKTVESMDFEGEWVDESRYEIRYMAEEAGDFMLHVWMDTDGSGDRKWLPGSPFAIRVSGVRASALGSILHGTSAYLKLANADEQPPELVASPGREPRRSSKEDMGAAPTPMERRRRRASTANVEQAVPKLMAGERITLQPQLKDEFGNASFAAEGELSAHVIAPDDEHPIPITQGKGLGLYELSYDTHLKGLHILCVELNEENIQRSPFHFKVLPGPPVGSKSTLIQKTPTALVGQPCVLELQAVDKFGNLLEEGGASVTARGVGTGVQACTVEDKNNGTYHIVFTSNVVGEARVIVRLDNMEMAPLLVVFSNADGAKGKGKKGGKDEAVEGMDDASDPDVSDPPAAAPDALAPPAPPPKQGEPAGKRSRADSKEKMQ